MYLQEILELDLLHSLERDLISYEERGYLEVAEQNKLIEMRFKEI